MSISEHNSTQLAKNVSCIVSQKIHNVCLMFVFVYYFYTQPLDIFTLH